jgi:snapalysin
MSQLRRLVGATLASAALLLGPAVPAQAAAAPRVVTYDVSRAAEFVAAVDQGAANWNARVTNVRLTRAAAGTRADIVVRAADGWPYAITRSLGRGEVSMGRQAVRERHSPVRIAAHEFGHLLGLPDDRTGRCADLMSGGSAPATCRNAFPNPTEAAKVQANFAGPIPVAAEQPKVFAER